jgi:hypothetical protein
MKINGFLFNSIDIEMVFPSSIGGCFPTLVFLCSLTKPRCFNGICLEFKWFSPVTLEWISQLYLVGTLVLFFFRGTSKGEANIGKFIG